MRVASISIQIKIIRNYQKKGFNVDRMNALPWVTTLLVMMNVVNI